MHAQHCTTTACTSPPAPSPISRLHTLTPDTPIPPGSSSGRSSTDEASVYKRMIILVRSLFSHVRVLPAYRMYRMYRAAKVRRRADGSQGAARLVAPPTPHDIKLSSCAAVLMHVLCPCDSSMWCIRHLSSSCHSHTAWYVSHLHLAPAPLSLPAARQGRGATGGLQHQQGAI
jgi:hypothetical protein